MTDFLIRWLYWWAIFFVAAMLFLVVLFALIENLEDNDPGTR